MKELEQKIRRAVEHTAPDQLDSILSSCDRTKNIARAWPEDAARRKKGAIIHMADRKTNQTKRRTGLAAIAAMAAMFILCFGIYSFFLRGEPASSVITMDVNPSLSLHVDAKERIVAAEALNPDAKEILGSMELEGTSLDVAVNAIIGSMLQKGYLGDLQNSILVSVEDKDADHGALLQQKVSQAIADALEGGSLNAAILTQTIEIGDDALAKLASQYQISLGKAALIQEVIRQAPGLTFEALAPMSINEIALIAASRNVSSESVIQSGAASDKAYISREEAQSKAYAHAGVTAEEVAQSRVEFDSDNGVMVYEVQFETAAAGYEYEIDARTGQVLEYESEEKGATTPQEENSGNYIGQEEARNRAYAHAGVTAKDVLKAKVELDDQDGVMIYEVEFETAAVTCEYEIDARTGRVLEYASKEKKTGSVPPAPTEQSGDKYIGQEEARNRAYAHAGIAAEDVLRAKVELDDQDGVMIYEVEFETAGAEYDYEINALTGKVLHHSEERHHHDHDDKEHGGTESYIGESAALEAALRHAGVEASSITEKSVELDEENGQLVYEVEFEVGRMEYHYVVDPTTGEILYSHSEQD